MDTYKAVTNFEVLSQGLRVAFRTGDSVSPEVVAESKLLDRGLIAKDVVQPNIKIKHT